MNNGVIPLPSQRIQPERREQVLDGMRIADQFGYSYKGYIARDPILHAAFRPIRRPADQRDIVARPVEASDREQSVLRGAAHDEAGNDVQDADPFTLQQERSPRHSSVPTRGPASPSTPLQAPQPDAAP